MGGYSLSAMSCRYRFDYLLFHVFGAITILCSTIAGKDVILREATSTGFKAWLGAIVFLYLTYRVFSDMKKYQN